MTTHADPRSADVLLHAIRTQANKLVNSDRETLLQTSPGSLLAVHEQVLKDFAALDSLISYGAPYPHTWMRTKVYTYQGRATCGHCGGTAASDDEFHIRGGGDPDVNTPLVVEHGCRARFTEVVDLADVGAPLAIESSIRHGTTEEQDG